MRLLALASLAACLLSCLCVVPIFECLPFLFIMTDNQTNLCVAGGDEDPFTLGLSLHPDTSGAAGAAFTKFMAADGKVRMPTLLKGTYSFLHKPTSFS